MPSKKPVFVVTGPSGAGKGTLIDAVLPLFPELEVAVSATTREQRPGEVDGVHYWFLTPDEFVRRAEAGEFLEWVEYVSGHRYGTLRSEIRRIADQGHVCLLELETEGALAVRDTVPGAVTIFVTAPIDQLERRLRERATESSGEIGERIRLAREQLRQQDEFHDVVENAEGQQQRATRLLAEIVGRHLRSAATMTRP